MIDALVAMERARVRWDAGKPIERDGVMRHGPQPIEHVVYVPCLEERWLGAAYWRIMMKTLPEPGMAAPPPIDRTHVNLKPTKRLVHWRFFERGQYFDIVEERDERLG